MEQVLTGSMEVRAPVAAAEGTLQELLMLRARSIHDTVTSAYNRRHFEQQVGTEWRRARRNHSPLSVMMTGIDGREDAGDPGFSESLERLAIILLRQCARAGDLVARYDGTRFALLLPNTDVAGGEMLARRLCQRVEQACIRQDDGGYLTVSVGLATAASPTSLASGSASLVLRAHRALREARQFGGSNYRAAPVAKATIF